MADYSTTATGSPALTWGMSKATLKGLSHLCFVLGFASIVASIIVWVMSKAPDAGHGERFGIFIGLWAPTFFALSDRFDRYATA